jgi:sulfatase modifying factor 1
VGAYTLSVSPYGTFDQGGNVTEWNESVLFGTFRGHRGGEWGGNEIYMRASFRNYVDEPSFESDLIGFRVASAAIPEPSAFLLIITSLGALLVRRRKSVPHNRI